MRFTVNLFEDYWQLCIKKVYIHDGIVRAGYKHIRQYSD